LAGPRLVFRLADTFRLCFIVFLNYNKTNFKETNGETCYINPMRVIEKKIWPEMFEVDKELPVDFRLADFKLKDGDKIRYREWDPQTKQYTGREYTKSVKRVTKHESPTRYWRPKDLEKHGFFIIEFK
jgi:hypothetical protein